MTGHETRVWADDGGRLAPVTVEAAIEKMRRQRGVRFRTVCWACADDLTEAGAIESHDCNGKPVNTLTFEEPVYDEETR